MAELFTEEEKQFALDTHRALIDPSSTFPPGHEFAGLTKDASLILARDGKLPEWHEGAGRTLEEWQASQAKTPKHTTKPLAGAAMVEKKAAAEVDEKT